MSLPIQDGATYILSNDKQGLVADGFSYIPNIRGEKKNGTPAQEWTFSVDDKTNSYWFIKNGNGKYLAPDTASKSLSNGTLLTLSDDRSTSWKVVNQVQTPGTINILDTSGIFGADLASSTPGYNIHLWRHSNGGPGYQTWRPDLVAPPKPPKVEPSIAFTGKFKYRKNDIEENIFIVFPNGVVPNGLMYILTTWAETDNKAPFASATPIKLDTETGFVTDAGSYVWKGKTKDNWKTLELEIWHSEGLEPGLKAVSTQILNVYPEV